MTLNVDDKNSEIKNKSYGKLEIFSNYACDTTIHGFRNIGGDHRHWIERIFWAICFIASVIMCTFVVFQTYSKWQSSPVIMTFNERLTPIWEIPFPAVTFCPETQTNVHAFNITESVLKLGKYLNNFDELTVHEMECFEALCQVCDSRVYNKIWIPESIKFDGSDVVPERSKRETTQHAFQQAPQFLLN